MRKSLLSFIIIPIFTGLAPSLSAQVPPALDALDKYIGRAIRDFDLTGLAIAIVKDGQVVLSKGYGYKDAGNRSPMTPTALFNIASCTKAMTAACVAMLISEGKLRWKDKVRDELPEFQLADPYLTANMNILDMLSHRSGLGTFYGDLLWYETDYSNAEIIRRMRYLPVTNDFRSEFGYQNNFYMIAGEIIQRISGKSWSQFVYERLFAPLEMTESRTHSRDLAPGQEIAFPHIHGKKQEVALYNPNPAGTVYSNVLEMSSWMSMLLNHGLYNGRRILDENALEMLFSPQTILNLSAFMKKNNSHFHAYGLGWFLFDYSGRKIVEHDGGMPGYISKVTLVPEEHLGLVLLANDLTLLLGALRYKILDHYLSGKDRDWAAEFLGFKAQSEAAEDQRRVQREAARIANTTPSLPLDKYAGIYTDKMYGDAKIDLRDGVLHLSLLPTAKKFSSSMEHWHLDTFRIKFKDEFLPEGFVTFSLNADAEVTGFKIYLPNPDFHFFNLDFRKTPN